MAGSGMHQTTQPSSSLVSSRGALPPDSEEFSNLFNQLMDPNHSGSDYTTPPNPVPPSSSSSSTFNFSDPYSNASIPQPHANTSFNFTSSAEKNAEASELPSSKPVPPPPRSSSKRSRAAEFHNLSEKRRRSRINEKMKALQNLIPNSNKTDKASMLDEAIEYLKQLQLQVQMLMMRNGLSLHPMSLSGGPRPMMLAQTGLNLDEGNAFQNIASSANDEGLMRPGFSFPEQCSISNQSVMAPSVTNIASLHTSSSFQPSIKDELCGNMPQLFLDTTKIGTTPAPDVS